MTAAAIVGHIDKLGYLYCVECYPVESTADLVWSDDGTYRDELCELCHRPLRHTMQECGA